MSKRHNYYVYSYFEYINLIQVTYKHTNGQKCTYLRKKNTSIIKQDVQIVNNVVQLLANKKKTVVLKYWPSQIAISLSKEQAAIL